MGKVKNYLLATTGLVILGGAVHFVMPLQAAPPAKDVNVVNMAANPVPVVVQNGNDYGFVGFSTGDLNGGQGLIAMHAECQADFVPLARTCTGKEFWLSPNATGPGAASTAWVHPVRFILETFRNCEGWVNDAAQGLAVEGLAGYPEL